MRSLAFLSRDSGRAVTDVLGRDPGPGEVRVKVEAASVNGFDLAVAGGRLWDHLPHEFPARSRPVRPSRAQQHQVRPDPAWPHNR
jgi:NADPH:quinone reductase-like Zn-dependent oxidoreductase